MLYFLHFLSDGGDIFNLFRYITFRAGGAFFTSLAFGFLLSKPIINLLKKKQKEGQPIREDGPETHKIKKAGTPTMGGVLIIGSLLFSTLIWCRYDISYVWIVIFVTLGFGLIGFIDDFSKLHNNNTRGISGKIRLFLGFLEVHYIAGSGEIAVFSAALIGAGLGFLWYNAPPAAVFMGDTGSLALGGALGAISVCTKHEIVLAIIGGLFVLEALSVIIQVAAYKLTGKRVFLMAPIHHHFEKLGWAEPQIVIRFWIISVILALVGLATLKLR